MCDADVDCHSVAFHAAAGSPCDNRSTSANVNASSNTSSGTRAKGSNGGWSYKIMALGASSTVKNDAWVAYAKPGHGPLPPPPTPPTPPAAGSYIHKSTTGPGGEFLPVSVSNYGSCNNPSPFQHKNGTLFLACTGWLLKSAPAPEGPWRTVQRMSPPKSPSRTWEDPYLFINDRGFHLMS